MTVARLNSAQVLAIGCIGVLLGAWIKRKLPVLERLNIPTPIVGGMNFALLAPLMHSRNFSVESDGSLRDLSMIAFMTTIGLSARLKLIREGRRQVTLASGRKHRGRSPSKPIRNRPRESVGRGS